MKEAATTGKRILMTLWPFTGHVHPNLAIAGALRNRGHRVAFYTGRSAEKTVTGEGFEFFPFHDIDEERINQIVLSQDGILSSQRRLGRLKSLYEEWLLGSIPAQLKDLESIMRNWQPDAIVCDPTFWAPFLILRETKEIPVAVFSLIPACLLSGKDAPIFGFPLPRAKTSWERLRAGFLRRLSRLFLAGMRRAASRVRESHGLPPLTMSVTDFAATGPLYLVPSSPEFDYQRQDLPPSVRYVGPCLWNNAKQEPSGRPALGLNPDLPWLYVSEGTVHLDPVVLRCAAQGLAGLPVEVIMTTGRHRDPDTLNLGPRPLAPNIHVHQWVEFNELLPWLSAVVSVGGPSTLMAPLCDGTPVVIVPFAWDHPETGWRIRESGAGVLIRPSECTPDRMRDAVLAILNEGGYRRKAGVLAAGFRRLGGAPRAAELIEEMCNTCRSPSATEVEGRTSAP